MNNFWTRTLTGAALVSVMIGCILWNYWSLAALFFAISLLGVWEFYTLLEKANFYPQKIYGALCGSGIFFILAFLKTQDSSLYTVLLILLPLPIFIFELFRKKDNPFINIAITALGIFYVMVPFALLLSAAYAMRRMENLAALLSGPSHGIGFYKYFILGFFLLIWSNDTFAYLTGSLIGRTKFFERISPKKTWEGTLGGALCTQGIAWLISLFFTDMAPLHWHAVGLIVSVFGTLGDLVKSLLKRSLGIKDSGTILPGHGGILDRFDAVLLASPFVTSYLMLIR